MTISKNKTKELISEYGKSADDSGSTESQISIFSERIRLINNESITNENIINQITLTYTDGNQEEIEFSAIIQNEIIADIIPTNDLDEARQLSISIQDSLIEDTLDNFMETQIASYTVRDVSPPIINNQLSSISTSNVYVILSFSENIYTILIIN